MKSNQHKKREGIVYSTNPDFAYTLNNQENTFETLPPAEQKLQVVIDKKSRAGKTVSLVKGFVGTEKDLETLCKLLKNKCGVGGSAKDGEIIIQGDQLEKIKKILTEEGYKKTR